MVVTLTSCVSPFYGTARIEKGFHAEIGVATHSFLFPWLDAMQYGYRSGMRSDVELRYGFNRYLGLHARAALGVFYNDPLPFLDAGVGIQTALPLKWVTPALRSEVSLYGGCVTLSPTLLVGIGREEKVTLGGCVHLFGNSSEANWDDYHKALEDTPTDFFVGIHAFPRWTLFVGTQLFYHSYIYPGKKPLYTIGVGYKLK